MLGTHTHCHMQAQTHTYTHAHTWTHTLLPMCKYLNDMVDRRPKIPPMMVLPIRMPKNVKIATIHKPVVDCCKHDT